MLTIFQSFIKNPNLILQSLPLTGLDPNTNIQQFGNGITYMMNNFSQTNDTDFLSIILSDSLQPRGYNVEDTPDLDDTPKDFAIDDEKQIKLVSSIFNALDMSNANSQMLLSNANQMAIQNNNQSVKSVTTSIISSIQHKQQSNLPQQTLNQQSNKSILEPVTVIEKKQKNRNIQL